MFGKILMQKQAELQEVTEIVLENNHRQSWFCVKLTKEQQKEEEKNPQFHKEVVDSNSDKIIERDPH